MPQPPERTPFGEWLHGWRQKRRLTQDQLAQAALISKRDVERYETKVAPRGDTFLRLLSALGLSVDGMPTGPKAINAEVMELRKELGSLRRSFDRRLEAIAEHVARVEDAVAAIVEGLPPAESQPRRDAPRR